MKTLTLLRLSWPALLLLVACSDKPLLADADLPFLRTLTEQVNSEHLMQDIATLHDLHLSDTPLDCSRWPFLAEVNQPYFCHQTNTKAGAQLETWLGELSLKVKRQPYEGEHFFTSNVVAELTGVTHPEEVVLVGAHFDSFHGGADDNSSGVAAMLEMARVLSQYRFDRTLLFVGFDLEELGAVGANRFLIQLPESQKLVAALNLDAIGYYSEEPGSQLSFPGLPKRSTGDFLALIGNAPSSELAVQYNALSEALELIPVVTMLAPGKGTYPLVEPLLRSDHSAFWSHNVPMVFATDTALFRNPHYHKSTDTPETLHPGLYRKAVQLNLAVLAYWAGGPR